jgi:hypothetical protein
MTLSRGPRYISVDELMPQVTLEQAAEYYGILLPELRRVGNETRTKCFLACGRSGETGDRTLAIQESDPSKRWACHHYGCSVRGGNLVSLCDLMKDGPSMNGRPRGERFKEIARDLAAMANGESPGIHPSETSTSRSPLAEQSEETPSNVPLAESSNERARSLVSLDEQFLGPDRLAEMSPAAARYFRKRPFLDPVTCEKYRIGYLPLSSKSLLRGRIVYPYFSASGELLTWFGRDPLFEEKKRKWLASDRSESEPMKVQFVRGFHRGLELWGESMLRQSAETRSASEPLVVVEGPNDAVALQQRSIRAVALCSNVITAEQVDRIATLFDDLQAPGGKVILLLDNDVEGENGMKLSLPLLAEQVPVQLGWSRRHAKYLDRQPESLSSAEIADLLHGGEGGET